jgi:hypothetical protein
MKSEKLLSIERLDMALLAAWRESIFQYQQALAHERFWF